MAFRNFTHNLQMFLDNVELQIRKNISEEKKQFLICGLRFGVKCLYKSIKLFLKKMQKCKNT